MRFVLKLCCAALAIGVASIAVPVSAEDKPAEPAASASASPAEAPAAKKYACEHCKVTKDAPGKCECGMDLKEVEEKKDAPPAAESPAAPPAK